MTAKQLRASLDSGQIRNEYLLFGDEPLLIDRALEAIRNALKVDESFDQDRFSLTEATIEDIMAKLYLMPLISAKRLIIVVNLEDVHDRDLVDFADAVNRNNPGNCLVMVYLLKKDVKYYKNVFKRLSSIFSNAECVDVMPDRDTIKKWIQSKIRRDKLNLNESMVKYLEEEFGNDITGLKNEFDKIENYLHEAGTIDKNNMKDLSRGLCNFDRYEMVNAFLDGRAEALTIFEELQPYLRTNAILVDALVRGMLGSARTRDNGMQVSKTKFQDILEQLILVDRKIKTSSIFTRLQMELFILHNAGGFKNGVSYGR